MVNCSKQLIYSESDPVLVQLFVEGTIVSQAICYSFLLFFRFCPIALSTSDVGGGRKYCLFGKSYRKELFFRLRLHYTSINVRQLCDELLNVPT